MKNAEAIAYNMIINMVLSRSYAPGDRLVESEIAERVGLSRTPVRNAMRQLAAEGLLETRGNKGCFIPRLSPEDMSEVFKVRAFLEGMAALEAAHARTEKDLVLLKNLLKEEKTFYREGKIQEYAAINDQFHLLLGKLSHNSYIEKYARQAFWRSGLYLFNYDRFYFPNEPTDVLRDPDKSISCIQHEQIVNAIVISDGVLAESSARTHVYTSYFKMIGRIHQPGVVGIQP